MSLFPEIIEHTPGGRTTLPLLPGVRGDAIFSKCKHAVRSYAKLWNHINGAGAWEANPWVVAFTFAVDKINIDAYLKQREAA